MLVRHAVHGGGISVWLTTIVKPFWPAILLEPRYVPQVVNDLHQAGLIAR
jgi:hypothetical protein